MRDELAGRGTGRFPIVRAEPDRRPLDEWLHQHRVRIEEQLLSRGAVLFRGFEVESTAAFERVCSSLRQEMPRFDEESSPRSAVSEHVATATDYPREFPIQLHNEFSYARRWPRLLMFWCRTPASTQGATPIADSRQVLARLSPATRERFERTGVRYRRNFGPHLGVAWQVAFGVDGREAAEERLRALELQFEWLPGDRLRTTAVAEAIVFHPHTGEPTWFNHAFFFNVHAIEPLDLRQVLLAESEDDLSTQTYFGDGTPIPESVIEEIRHAFADETVDVDWEAGDVLLIDNMLTSHGRRSFTGRRELFVAMADPILRSELPSKPTSREPLVRATSIGFPLERLREFHAFANAPRVRSASETVAYLQPDHSVTALPWSDSERLYASAAVAWLEFCLLLTGSKITCARQGSDSPPPGAGESSR